MCFMCLKLVPIAIGKTIGNGLWTMDYGLWTMDADARKGN